MPPVAGLIGLNVLLVFVVALLLVRRSAGGSASLVQQQLVEVRARLDTLSASQSEIPRVLAESRADHATDLSEQLMSFANVVSGQLDAGQGSVNQRLADTGELITDIRAQLNQLSTSARRMEEIGAGVAKVNELLKVPQLRGTVGETWLDEMLQQMIPTELYERQYTFASGERVDCVVRLGDRLLSIDAKFPLDACQRMLAANGNARERERHRRAFHKTVRARVDEIAQKYIRPAEGTFDFALMYVPAERVYHEAITDADNLMAYALSRRVVLTSPNTLYAYLATMLHGLRAFHVEQHAREVADTMSGLQITVEQVMRTYDTLGKHIENSAKQHGELGRLVHKMRTQLAGVPGHVMSPRRSRPFTGVTTD